MRIGPIRLATVAVLVLALGLIAMGGGTAMADHNGTLGEFSGLVYTCQITPPPPGDEFFTDGGTLHYKNSTNKQVFVTDNPLVDGVLSNVVNGMFNLNKGTGIGHLKGALQPDGVDGTWETVTNSKLSGGAIEGHGTGRGTRDLHGMTLKYETSRIPSDATQVCSDHGFTPGFVSSVEGVINGHD